MRALRCKRSRARLVAGIAATLLAAVPAQASASARAGARRGGVQAFLLTGSPDSFADLRAHAAQVSVVYPTYYECAPSSGRVVGQDSPQIDRFARAEHIALLPRFTCQDGATVHRMLTDPVLRAATLATLARLAARRAFGGLCVDLENDGADDRAALTSFVAALASELHALRKRLTVVVDGVSEELPGSSTYFYDERALAAAADTVFVLAWGAHWEGSAAGPLAPLAYVKGVARYVASLPDHARFVIGAPLYGIDWTEGAARGAAGSSGASVSGGAAVAYQYAGIHALQHALGTHATRDPTSGEMTFAYTSSTGATHRVWYMDARAVLDVLAIARAHGLGVGLWRLGEEDQSMWSSALLGGSG